jgi:hypothetical protein
MILCELHGYVWHPTDKECPHCAKGEYSIPEGPTLKLAFEIERLRAEVERLENMVGATFAADPDEWPENVAKRIAALTADLDGARENALLHASRNVALETDLARVTAERDMLLKAAKDVLACDKALSDARAWNEGHLDEVMLAELLMVQSFAPLHLAVAACAPPASGEVKP